MASTEFYIPEDIPNWVVLRNSHKLKHSTLSSLDSLQSGSKIKPDQFILFRALWSRRAAPDLFKAQSGIAPKHWADAQKALEASTSLNKFLDMAKGDISLVNLIESDEEWPGAFASVRRYQEEILQVNASAPKRKASPDPDSRQSRPRTAKAVMPGLYDEEGSVEVTEIIGAGPSSGLQAPRLAASVDLDRITLDETVVNVYLVLLLQELISLKRSSNLQCTITRVRYVPKFGTKKYTTVVDGVVRSRKTGNVEAILEIMPVRRFPKVEPVQMQETAEAVGWLQRQTSGVPQLRNQSRLIIYQGHDEIYLTLMAPGTRYVEYLGRTTPTTTVDKEEFMTMRTFGPWEIKKQKQLRSLCSVLLAFMSAAEEAA